PRSTGSRRDSRGGFGEPLHEPLWTSQPKSWNVVCAANAAASRGPHGERRRQGDPISSVQLRDMLRENFAYLAQVGPTRQRLLHVAQRGRDVRQERRVLLHPIDEDEPPRVLELALHREQIEEGDELVGVQVR